MKKLLIGLGVLVLIIVIGLALFVNYGTEPTIKYALESQGTAITENDVTVQAVDLSLLGGSLSLGGLKLANPSGFTASDAMSLGEVRVDLDRKSLFSKEIVVDRILLEAPVLTFERGQGSSNLEIIKEAIDRYMPQTEDQSEPPVTVLVRELLVKGAKLNYNLKPGAKLRTITLPDAKVENIGTGEGGEGVSIEVAIDQIVEQMTPVVIRELAKAEGVDAIKGLVKDPGKLKDMLGDNLGDGLLKDGGGDVKETIEESVGGALKGFKGLSDKK